MGRTALFILALAGCGHAAPSPPSPAVAAVAAVDAGLPPPVVQVVPPPSTGPVVDTSQVLEGGVCITKDIAAYCSGKPCPTFQESWDADTTTVKSSCGKGEDPRIEMGRCGNGHYISSNGGYSGYTLFFDSKGKLIAVSTADDYMHYCDGQAFGMQYGVAPKCKLQPLQKVCSELSL